MAEASFQLAELLFETERERIRIVLETEGETAEILPDFNAAIQAYARVIERFPRHPLTEDALYGIAYCYTEQGDPDLAADVVWFDAFVTNVDRTARNANMLSWHGGTWLIDHGASLYFHHDWGDMTSRVEDPFTRVRDHVLLPFAGDLQAADARAHARLGSRVFEAVINELPELWMEDQYRGTPIPAVREAYRRYFDARLSGSGVFVEEAIRARAQLV